MQSQLGGKLLIFQNTLPSLGVGRLKLRGDDSRVYGTDKEHGLRLPEDPFYKQMAAEFSKYQISTNVYAFSDKYTDIASLGKFLQFLLNYATLLFSKIKEPHLSIRIGRLLIDKSNGWFFMGKKCYLRDLRCENWHKITEYSLC